MDGWTERLTVTQMNLDPESAQYESVVDRDGVGPSAGAQPPRHSRLEREAAGARWTRLLQKPPTQLSDRLEPD